MDNNQTQTINNIAIENSSQELHQELSLKEISAIALQNWPLFVLLVIFSTAMGLSYYKWSNPYVAKSSIIIHDNQNSQLQSLSISLAGGTGKTNEAKKNNSVAQKQIEYFKTTDFYAKILSAIENANSLNQLTLAEKNGLNKFTNLLGQKTTDNLTEKLSDEQKLIAYQILDQMLNFKVKNDFEIEVATSASDREVALFLVNIAAKVSLENLKEKEVADITAMKGFLQSEKDNIDKELLELNKKMATFNDKPENIISLSSREKVGEYLSELMVRKNETLMKITENNKIIQTLSSGVNNRRESMLYGNNGKIQSLKLENDLLRSKLGQIQTAIDRVSNEAKGMPYAAQMYEELKKRSDLQLNRFKEISDSLAKIEALAFAVVNKYEIFERARLDKVLPMISLVVVLFLSVIVALLFGSIIIYLRAIWDSNIVTAKSTRNVVVIDSHSIDPRVIIENSKIRFRLRNSNIADDDPENGTTKKLGFNFGAKDQNG